MIRKTLMVLLFVVIVLPSFEQEFDSAGLNDYFDTLVVHNKFMGSIAIVQNGKTMYQRSTGFSDLDQGIRATGNSEYGIGEITQTFTAILIMKAVEEKKLDLNQTIDTYYPKIPNAGVITIKHLLSHRSGIHNFSALTLKSERKLVRQITNAGTDFVPGSKPVFNELNYMLLTYILEKTYKTPYSELLATYITGPTGLKHTYLGSRKKNGSNFCKSYRYLGNWKLWDGTEIHEASGAGGIISTPEDLAKFCDALFGGMLLNKESLDIMTPLQEPVGSGLLQKIYNDRIGYGWSGEIDGFVAEIIHFPESRLSYAMVSNGINYHPGNIAKAVLSTLFDQQMEIPVIKTFNVSPEDLDKYIGVYSNLDHESSVRISKDNNTLIARGKGLSVPYALDATEEDKFTLDLFNMEFEFDPVEGLLLLKEPGSQILFTRKYMDFYFYDIGVQHLDSMNLSEAIDCFTKAIQLNSGTTEYFFLRGGAYFQLERYDMAVSDFNHCYRIIPDEAEYPYLIGMCHEKLNEFEMAILNYNHAIRLDSLDSRYYKARADLYFKTQEYPKALIDYDQVLGLDPRNGNAYYQRGVIRYKMNEKDRACADWKSAMMHSFQQASEYFEKICKENDD